MISGFLQYFIHLTILATFTSGEIRLKYRQIIQIRTLRTFTSREIFTFGNICKHLHVEKYNWHWYINNILYLVIYKNKQIIWRNKIYILTCTSGPEQHLLLEVCNIYIYLTTFTWFSSWDYWLFVIHIDNCNICNICNK